MAEWNDLKEALEYVELSGDDGYVELMGMMMRCSGP